MSIALSREELEAARNLVESGFPRQAISRAYYAAFYAARAALEAAGEPSPQDAQRDAKSIQRPCAFHCEHRLRRRQSAQPTRHGSDGGRLRSAHHHEGGGKRRDHEGARSA
jgi:hypothetical protein